MRKMKNCCALTVVFLIAAALSVRAQTLATKPAAPSPNAVVATYDNKTLTQADLQMFKKLFVPAGIDDQRIIDLWKLNGYLADKARKEKTLDDPTLKLPMQMATDQLLTRAYIRKKQMASPVTDAEVKDYYEKNKTQKYSAGDFVTGKIIAVEKKQDADNIKTELTKGKTFDQAVKQYAEQTQKVTGLSGPEFKDMSREQLTKVVGPMAWAMTASNLNEVIGPRQFTKGWMLFKITAKKPGPPMPFEKVKVDIEEFLRQKKAHDIQTGLIKEAEKATGASFYPKPGERRVFQRGDR